MSTQQQQHPRIIAYGYESAPNPQKLFQFLALFGIPYEYVEIPATMPRPDFAALGITYRKSPLLSIDSDMYVDTSLIISRLSDMAQHRNDSNGDGVGLLRDATNHVEYDGLGQQAFHLAVGLLPTNAPMLQDKAFIDDRSDFMGRTWDIQAMASARPRTLSKMLTLLSLVEGHFLQGGNRRFFLGGDQPTTADMHLYWGLNWGLRYHGGARPEILPETHPTVFRWLDAIERFIGARKSETKITMDEANSVLRIPPKHEYAKFVPHIEGNPEGLKRGQKIRVTPEDTGRSGPQVGDLISLNYEQVCLRNEKGLVMHFPRMGYEVVGVA